MTIERSHVGVGALFNPSMSTFIERSLSCLDYLAVIPDRGWIDHGRIDHGRIDLGIGASPRFQMLPSAEALLDQVAVLSPIVLHGIGMSICSAEFFDEEYAANLIALAQRFNSPWISDHLSFSRVGTGHELNSAITLPVPYDRQVLDMLIPRVQFFKKRFDRPFLLENNVYYFRYPGQDFSEEEFLNELSRQAGSGVLLDLHNLYTNSINHAFSATDYLANLDLDNVIEIHIAGGMPMMGFHTDSHTGPVLEPVWTLLEHVIPRAASLRGVTFEFHESSYSILGENGILEQIDHARAIVNSHREVNA
jgi:uncharacterized protein (UPF0276 family)